MSIAADLFGTLHALLLAGFLCVTLLLLGTTVLGRWRLRGASCIWPLGRWYGVPLAPLGFLTLVMVLMGYAWATGHGLEPAHYVGYLVGGLSWGLAVWLSRVVVVTAEGFREGALRLDRQILWTQVVDYFECRHQGRQVYVFFFHDAAGCRRRAMLRVPVRHEALVAAVLREQLRSSLTPAPLPTSGKQALEG